MGASTSKPVDLTAISEADLKAALEALRARTADEKGELALPFIESILPHVTFSDSAAGKPWHGAVFNAQVVTSDGRKVRVGVTLTDVDITAAMKKAANA